MRKYYEAYEERYKTAHEAGIQWASNQPTPIVLQTLRKYAKEDAKVLEIGCGEGRDSIALLKEGYHLRATDISKEAVAYCKRTYPAYESAFTVENCFSAPCEKYSFVYAVAVLHMLVEDADRRAFYNAIKARLAKDGVALICTMGDGEHEFQTDVSQAFELQERSHPAGTIKVAATSCRMVSFSTFERELAQSGFIIVEKGYASALPDFDSLLYAVVRRGE